jgi:hypothetical protein
MDGNRGFVVRHEKGRNYPALVCEACGEIIKDVEMAGVVWERQDDPDGKSDTVTVLCKTNNCLSSERYKNLPWQEMRHYLLWVLANSGVNTEEKLQKAWEAAERMNRI